MQAVINNIKARIKQIDSLLLKQAVNGEEAELQQDFDKAKESLAKFREGNALVIKEREELANWLAANGAAETN